uniref:Uncharacterized protein n=1 Tax=Hyaloperonospora arabidopsidis (strain Emoy2) TaxID=559515 RepID=M4B7L6_HYAAE
MTAAVSWHKERPVHVVLPASNNEYQVAYKKVPMADDTGAAYTPTSNSGVKLESFIWYLPVVVADGGSFCFSGD